MPEPELSLLFLRPLNRLGVKYAIVRKLEYFREGGSDKHLRDIRAMCHVSAEQIDQRALKGWIVRQGVEAQWQQARV
jgi:hypothetical protein